LSTDVLFSATVLPAAAVPSITEPAVRRGFPDPATPLAAFRPEAEPAAFGLILFPEPIEAD
jgi:hypothetical protein